MEELNLKIILQGLPRHLGTTPRKELLIAKDRYIVRYSRMEGDTRAAKNFSVHQ